MATLLSSPKFTTFEPVIFQSDGEVSIGMSIGNFGTAPAANVYVTGLTLGSARRISPDILPVYLGDIKFQSRATVNTRFSAAQLVAGQKYLFTVRGTYVLSGTTYGFAVNRYVVIPVVQPAPVVLLKARATAVIGNAQWTYTLFNDEPAGSSLFVAAFSLQVANPFSVTGTPAGWAVLANGAGSVCWYSLDKAPNYPSQVTPASSLGGFQIQSATPRSESTPFILCSWDHAANAAGATTFDSVASPGR